MLRKFLNITNFIRLLEIQFQNTRLEKRTVRSHNHVRALFAENKVRFARAEQLCSWQKPKAH